MGCMRENSFVAYAKDKPAWTESKKWQLKEDVKGKMGWIADATGKQEEITFKNVALGKKGRVNIEFLQSYQDLGKATCKLVNKKGTAGELQLDGIWPIRSSQLSYAKLNTKNAPPGLYDLKCTSDGKKFKITSVL